jgi:hypothetical protein
VLVALTFGLTVSRPHVATALTVPSVSVFDSVGGHSQAPPGPGTTSIGASAVTFGVIVIVGDAINFPGPGTVTLKTGAGATLCSIIAGGTNVKTGSCLVQHIAKFPVLKSPPAGYTPSPIRYGVNTITATWTPSPSDASTYASGSATETLRVVAPPVAAYKPPVSQALTMSLQGPCSPTTYIQGDDHYANAQLSSNGQPTADLWDLVTNAGGTDPQREAPNPNNPTGTTTGSSNQWWAYPGTGCQAQTTASDGQVFGADSASHRGYVPNEDNIDPAESHYPGCAVNFEQAGCANNPTTWDVGGKTLNCATYGSLPKVNGIAAIAIAAAGSGYKANDTGVVNGGNNDAHYKITDVGTGGEVTALQIAPVGSNPAGSNYNTTQNPHTTAPGSPQPGVGIGLKVNITGLTHERNSGESASRWASRLGLSRARRWSSRHRRWNFLSAATSRTRSAPEHTATARTNRTPATRTISLSCISPRGTRRTSDLRRR